MRHGRTTADARCSPFGSTARGTFSQAAKVTWAALPAPLLHRGPVSGETQPRTVRREAKAPPRGAYHRFLPSAAVPLARYNGTTSQAAEQIVGLVPAFQRSVQDRLRGDVAECLVVYWAIATANDSIDSAPSSRLSGELIPAAVASPASSFGGDQHRFETLFQEMLSIMKAGKDAASAMGAGSAYAQDQRTLFIMNVAKAALAVSGGDDTSEEQVTEVMTALGRLHEQVWPIVRSAGSPK